MTVALAALVITGCAKIQEPYSTASADDVPRVLQPDFPQGTGGEAPNYKTLKTDENLNITVIVTPADYCTVEWYDYLWTSEPIATGLTIDMPLMAGRHEITLKVTTTAGKSTTRTFGVNVGALATDPVVDKGISRWLNPGTTMVSTGKNLDGIVKVWVGSVEATLVGSSEDALSFVVPTMALGDYKLIVEKTDGKRYCCADVTVSDQKWVDPAVTELILWEGEAALNWDANNIKVEAGQLADVPVGTEITIEYTKMDASELTEVYWALRITTPIWGDDPEKDDILPQTDFGPITGNIYTIVYDDRVKALIAERGAMCLVGNGLRVYKISCIVQAADPVLWEGDATLNWDANNIKVEAGKFTDVSVGSEIVIEYTKMDASELTEVYWALRITTPIWGDDPEKDDILAQTDFGPITGNTYTIVYDDRVKALIAERGAMCLVGNGLRITSITLKQ
jgi:hypothetical protein